MSKQKKLCIAVIEGDLDRVTEILNDSNINPTEAIRLASCHGHQHIVDFLIKDPRVKVNKELLSFILQHMSSSDLEDIIIFLDIYDIIAEKYLEAINKGID